MGNMILFPAPPATYDITLPELVWIPEDMDARRPCRSARDIGDIQPAISASSPTGAAKFPALWLQQKNKSQHTLLYFHGNSCDLGEIYDEILLLSRFVECNILAFEFPGYGVCKNVAVSPSTIDAWGRAAFNWLVFIGAEPMSIIPYGRSIGTGPAARLAASLKKEAVQVGGLIMHSPYMSVHKVVADYFAMGTWVIGNYWDTEASLEGLAPTTPMLIVHGMNDEVIDVRHGQILYNTYKADSSVKEGFFPVDSEHNAYLVIDDLGAPIVNFLGNKSLSRQCRPQNMSVHPLDRVVPPAYRPRLTATSGPTFLLESRTLDSPDCKSTKGGCSIEDNVGTKGGGSRSHPSDVCSKKAGGASGDAGGSNRSSDKDDVYRNSVERHSLESDEKSGASATSHNSESHSVSHRTKYRSGPERILSLKGRPFSVNRASSSSSGNSSSRLIATVGLNKQGTGGNKKGASSSVPSASQSTATGSASAAAAESEGGSSQSAVISPSLSIDDTTIFCSCYPGRSTVNRQQQEATEVVITSQ